MVKQCRGSCKKRATMLLALLWVFAMSAVRAAPVNVLVLNAQGQVVADAVISLVPVGAASVPVPSEKVSIAQIDKEFLPRVTVIGTGTKVWFPNRDKVRHHVYSFSPAKKFDIKLYAGDPPAPVLFDKPGVVLLGCNIHDWMIAYVVVTDAPYYGKSDAQGKLTLNNVAAGDYTIHVWHAEQTGAEFVQKMHAGAEPVSVQIKLTLKPSAMSAIMP